MRTLIIMNPAAGSAGQAAALRERVNGMPDVTLLETDSAGHARDLARDAVTAGYDLVVAAGGDGTINEVVQGLSADLDRARLGVLPLGTGNDLARSLAIPGNPTEALEWIAGGGRERRIDLIHVASATSTSYCVNVAAGGFSGQVDEMLTDEMKSKWGPLSYIRAAAGVLPNLEGYTTSLAYDDGEHEEIMALNVILANGRTCAGGLKVAPTADLEDGLIDVVIVRYTSLLDLAAVAALLVAGSYLDSQDVFLRRARRVSIHSRPGMWFNVDGELLTKEPATFTVVPGALRVLAGPGYGGS
jgi:diacylglycerol kinase (ATP)